MNMHVWKGVLTQYMPFRSYPDMSKHFALDWSEGNMRSMLWEVFIVRAMCLLASINTGTMILHLFSSLNIKLMRCGQSMLGLQIWHVCGVCIAVKRIVVYVYVREMSRFCRGIIRVTRAGRYLSIYRIAILGGGERSLIKAVFLDQRGPLWVWYGSAWILGELNLISHVENKCTAR